MSKIWVFAEVSEDGQPTSTTLEMLTKARSLGGTVEAVALGPGATKGAEELGRHGATAVYASEEKVFAEFLAQPAAHALAELVSREQPNLILFSTDYDSRDIAARLGARTGSTVMSNASDVLAVDRAQTQIFGGQKIVDVALSGPDPKIVLVRAKSFPAEPAEGTAEVRPVDVQIPESELKARRTERHQEEAEGPKLEDAKVVIAGGRGLGKPENFDLLEQIASEIPGSAVGATRAVVDAGWVGYNKQIGQTGKTVKPQVYIACGISGASQHQVGMKESRNIIAINKDAEAPILSIADLGVVGDVLKVLPQVVEEIRKRKG
ncbi:MAG TPA: electron transfer flavoprotein subunit alpha/FixB family protein [Actinomycetota bacterium]|nr:electron transfer flavoprotein subunit alpha/FixB family protein [Actinomycetota bacterium]